LALKVIPKIIEEGNYSASNVFNFDETGLLYKALPNRTLAEGKVKGKKLSKERMTLGLACNADGSEKLKMVVVHKSKRPRCFGRTFDPDTLVHWFSNKTAWMQSGVFATTMQRYNSYFHGRKVLMLMDNAATHQLSTVPLTQVHGLNAYVMSNMTILFMPANVTSVVQPLDQGVIAAFKMQYKKKMLTWTISTADTNPDSNLGKIAPDAYKVLQWLVQVWKDMQPHTISNCWAKSGLLPVVMTAELRANDNRAGRTPQQWDGLADLLSALSLPNDEERMTVEEFMQLDEQEPTEDDPSLEQIVQHQIAASVAPGELEADIEDAGDAEVLEVDNTPSPVVSLASARDAAELLCIFVRDNPESFSRLSGGDVDAAELVEALAERISQMVVANVHSKVQKSITDFFASAPAGGVVSSEVDDEGPIDMDAE
jgi:hypothetical protein